MKLSKHDRLICYRKVLHYALDSKDYIGCFCLWFIRCHCPMRYGLLLYPELWRYRPKEYFFYWFPRNPTGYKKRIAILRKIIKEMDKKK